MYIYTHLGIGDHIICHGIVRNLCEKFLEDEHVLLVTPPYLKSVSFMYKDLKNLKFECIDGDQQAHSFLKNISNNNKIYIGHHHLSNIMSQGCTFDQAFYKQVGLNFDKRWTDFKISRDKEKEEYLLNLLNPNNKPYIITHWQGSNYNRKIEIEEDIMQIEAGPITDNIFDWILLLENSKKFVTLASSFSVLIDQLNLEQPKILLNKPRSPLPIYKQKWSIL